MVTWKDMGVPPAWAASTEYNTKFDVPPVDPWAVTGGAFGIFINDTFGISDVIEPDWSTAYPFAFDGGVVWEAYNFGYSPWQANYDFYAVGMMVVPTTPNGHIYYAIADASLSGVTEPTWPTDGSTVEDSGALIPDDPDDNDTGTGPVSGALESTFVYQIWENPALDRDAAPIGTFTKAKNRSFRKVKQNCGEGSLTINVHDTEAAWCVEGRIVTVHRESVDNAPIFGWILEKGVEVVVTPDEEGGEDITWTGRGVLALLGNAVLYDVSFLPNGADLGALPQDDPDGRWHWLNKSGAAILVRQLEEMRQRGTEFGGGIQDCACPNVYWTFARHTDSLGNPYDEEGQYKLPVGDNLFSDAVAKLMTIGLLIDATPVINGAGHLRVRLDSWADDPGTATGITFTKGTDIEQAGERTKSRVGKVYSAVLVQGDVITGPASFNYRYRESSSLKSEFGRIEKFLTYHPATKNSTLDKAGDRVLAASRSWVDGPTTMQIVESTGKVAFVDYDVWDTVIVNIPGVWESVEGYIGAMGATEYETGNFFIGLQYKLDETLAAPALDGCTCATPEGGS